MTSRSIAYVSIVLMLVAFFYGYSQSRALHIEIENRLESDHSIVSNVGEVIKAEFIASESYCNFGGRCDVNYLYFNVTGEDDCIEVTVVVREDFPEYELESITPIFGTAKKYFGEKYKYVHEKHYLRCRNNATYTSFQYNDLDSKRNGRQISALNK